MRRQALSVVGGVALLGLGLVGSALGQDAGTGEDAGDPYPEAPTGHEPLPFAPGQENAPVSVPIEDLPPDEQAGILGMNALHEARAPERANIDDYARALEVRAEQIEAIRAAGYEVTP